MYPRVPRPLLRPALQLETRILTLAGQAAIHSQRAARHSFRDLWDAEVSVFSQWGEDGILDYICDAARLPRPRCLEIGAGNFRQCNTRWLAEARSASVVAVDARADLRRTIDALSVSWRSTVLPLQRWVSSSNVREVVGLAVRQLGGLDLVSLDVDGTDFWILRAMELDGVAVVVVEYNAHLGVNRAVSVPDIVGFDRTRAHWSNLYYGASLPAFVHLLKSRGFLFVGTNRAGTNAFFVHSSRLAAWQIDIPQTDPSSLSKYAVLRVRESRDVNGSLTRLSADDVGRLIADLPVVDTLTGEVVAVSGCLTAGQSL